MIADVKSAATTIPVVMLKGVRSATDKQSVADANKKVKKNEIQDNDKR